MSPLRSPRFRRFSIVLARVGLASTFLAGVADRFGAWGRSGTPGVAWGDLQHVVARVQAILPHVPAVLALFVAWLSTVLDAALGLALLIGLRTRTISLAAGVLLLAYAAVLSLGPGGLRAVAAYGLLAMAGASMLLASVAED